MQPGAYELFTTAKLPPPAFGFISTPVKELPASDANLVYFPNPTSGRVHIQYQGSKLENAGLLLLDASAKPILYLFQNKTIENGYSEHLDLEKYPIGIYFLNLFTPEGQQTFLLSKNN